MYIPIFLSVHSSIPYIIITLSSPIPLIILSLLKLHMFILSAQLFLPQTPLSINHPCASILHLLLVLLHQSPFMIHLTFRQYHRLPLIPFNLCCHFTLCYSLTSCHVSQKHIPFTMASRQSKGQGDRYFSESVSPTESEQKPLARARGFANLNEAFQNITVKKESTNDTSPEDASGNGPSRDRYNRKLTNASSGGQSDEATIRRSQDVGFSQPTTPAAGRLLTPRGAFPNEPLSTVAEMPRRDGAITRRGVRDEEPEIPKHTLHRAPVGYRPVGSPPSDGLPESPEVNMIRRHRRSMSLQDLSSPLASSSVSDSQRLLDPDVLALSLRRARRPTFPSSQKLPRQQNQTQYSSDEFIGVPSLDDSDVNYSNYHSMHSNPHDQVRLQPSREKNVSRALRHVSNAGEASQATFVTSDGSPIALKGPASPIPSDVAYANLQKLHPVRDIKVNIGGGTHHDNGWEKANETRDQLGPRDSTGDGDWVTELTSDVDQSSIYDQSGFPQQAVYQPEHNEAKPSGGFVSRFRVLQHPGKKVEPESYELRTLKDTKQQVFLPRTQAGGMGAYPENSTRNPFPRHSSRKLSNPFSRIDSYRRLDDNGSFNVKINREFPDHLRFRDSTASEYSAVKLGRKRASTLQPMSFYRVSEDAEPEGFCEEVSSSKEVQVSPQKPRLVDQDYPNRRSLGWWRSGKKRASRLPQLPSFNGEPITAQSKFPFELIPLDEAQRKNKLERESGETDETEPAAIRYQRAMSASSSQALPSSRRVRTPQPIHARGSHIAPHLSIDFSPSSVFYRDALHGMF
ncbi:hypothetical protein F4804DRAFT_310069 [Jackrogersella minutella]|nr:hypothetical protein F4804DRAFT_310069 [Jackrogersella minutella]